MAMRGLVEGECGAANPLVQWTSHFAQEKSMLKVGLDHDRLSDVTKHGQVTEEQLVGEFLGQALPPSGPAVPQTYNMASLLDQLQRTEQAPPPTMLHPSSTLQNDVRVKEWVEEFSPAQATPTAPPTVSASDWAQEFQRQHPASPQAEQWAKEFAPTTDEKWVEEFERQVSADRGLASVAKELSESVTDPSIQETEFMDFVKKLSTGEASISDQNEVIYSEDGWAREFESKEKVETAKKANGGFWDRLEREWQDLAEQEVHPWLSEFEQKPPVYKFQEDNPLKDVTSPLEEGLKRLAEGDLPSAVLLFEAEVQARPENSRSWQLLGSTQADNEQDTAAIAALHKCLELDSDDLLAHMSLAVCYTNESQQSKVRQVPVLTLPALQAYLNLHAPSHPASKGKALESLRNWISSHPKYSSLTGAAARTKPPHSPSFMTPEEHSEVRDLYLKAAQMSPESVDCDVQVGLGVLFNLSGEYDKAVDCFSAGLQVKPNEAMLWNKLGATLANSSRSEEAVEAYRKALEILPGFTRSRYNLGVSCINLGAHKEAVEHFLTALNLQRQAKGPGRVSQPSQMSESIWSTLRLALSLSNRRELMRHAESKDLDALMRGFGME